MGRYEDVKRLAYIEMIAEILFPVALDKTFYYKIPDSLKEKIKPGIRVYSSFSNRKKVMGYVMNIKDDLVLEKEFELKEIFDVIDLKPVFIVEKFIELARFISKRWVSPLGMVLGDFLRFLPPKIEYYNSFKKNIFKKNEKKIIVSSNIDVIIDKIKSLNDMSAIVFFPNILSLEIFSLRLKYYNIEFLKYSSGEKISDRKSVSSILLSGRIKVLLTTKAGVFLPFPDNSFFIVTDPINSMYRQFEQHPYYSTVELVDKITEIFSYPICYFSPSLSPSLSIKREKGWELEYVSPPKIDFEIRDIKKEGFDSDKFLVEMKRFIENNKKILIMSYSKYMASLVYCPKCGWIKRCDKCKTVMKVEIIDTQKNYVCSFCNLKNQYSNMCPKCQSVMNEKGSGAQKIYETLVSNFPDKKIIEIDGRCLYSKKMFDKTVNIISREDYDILVTTDIIAASSIDIKFDYVYMAVYESYNDFDYSYSERFIDKLSCVSCKINDNGKIYIYAYNTESYLFSVLKSENYILEEIAMRKNFSYPPYAYLYKIEIISMDKKVLKDKINDLIDRIEDNKTKDELMIIDYIPRLKIKKLRGEKYYIHSSWVKLKDYSPFFDFLKKYCDENKLKFNVIDR